VRSRTISKLGELLVAVVLALQAEAPGLGLGPLDDLAGPVLGRLHHLGALHHLLGPGPGGIGEVVAVGPHLGQVLLALLAEPAGLSQLVGEAVDGLLEQLEDLFLVDHRPRPTAAWAGRRR
jgi:hypothetical protein